ncbi:MAG: hypothetical protein WAV76_14650 [Bacteroidota bacterium]
MDTSESTPSKIQWKYFRTSLMMYVLFYLLPIFLLFLATRNTVPSKFIGIICITWVIGDIPVVAAIAAYRSKGSAFWEPVLAAITTLFLLMLVIIIINFVMLGSLSGNYQIVRDIIGPIVMFFLLSLFGVWIGGQIHKASPKGKFGSN